jgi:hypothetical protein
MSKPEPFVPIERARLLVTAGIARGRAERMMRADPLLAARIHWWRTGAHGHYPGCSCGTWASKLPRPEPEGVTTVSDSAAVTVRAMGADNGSNDLDRAAHSAKEPSLNGADEPEPPAGPLHLRSRAYIDGGAA